MTLFWHSHGLQLEKFPMEKLRSCPLFHFYNDYKNDKFNLESLCHVCRLQTSYTVKLVDYMLVTYNFKWIV